VWKITKICRRIDTHLANERIQQYRIEFPHRIDRIDRLFVSPFVGFFISFFIITTSQLLSAQFKTVTCLHSSHIGISSLRASAYVVIFFSAITRSRKRTEGPTRRFDRADRRSTSSDSSVERHTIRPPPPAIARPARRRLVRSERTARRESIAARRVCAGNSRRCSRRTTVFSLPLSGSWCVCVAARRWTRYHVFSVIARHHRRRRRRRPRPRRRSPCRRSLRVVSSRIIVVSHGRDIGPPRFGIFGNGRGHGP